MVVNSSSSKNKYKDLSNAEKARLAGAIWIHGSIDIEYSRKRGYYYPRIMLSMPNPLPFDYAKDPKEKVWVGNDGCFTLEIGRQKLVEKRLNEILPYIGGIEKEQIEIALQIIKINSLRKKTEKEKQKLRELYGQWKECSERLEKWVKDFKARYQNVKRRRVPAKIWNKAYLLEDC